MLFAVIWPRQLWKQNKIFHAVQNIDKPANFYKDFQVLYVAIPALQYLETEANHARTVLGKDNWIFLQYESFTNYIKTLTLQSFLSMTIICCMKITETYKWLFERVMKYLAKTIWNYPNLIQKHWIHFKGYTYFQLMVTLVFRLWKLNRSESRVHEDMADEVNWICVGLLWLNYGHHWLLKYKRFLSPPWPVWLIIKTP